MRQARAIPKRGVRRPRSLPRLRAPVAGFVLSLLFFLSPELTLAPLNAGEPYRSTSLPIDLLELPVAPSRVQPLDIAPRASIAIPSTTPPMVDDAGFRAAIEAARAAGGAYGVTFAVARDGLLQWTGAAGRARDGKTELTVDDGLVIGSVTKTYVAALVLQLSEEGWLRLDDPVRNHLPELTMVSPEITVRQLLDHTSGLADVFNETTRTGIEQHPEHAWTTGELLKTLHAPWYQPGEGWAYANTNYYLLGMIAERVTGAALADEIQRRFLGPLGLAHTRMLTADAAQHEMLSPAWATIFWASGAMTASAADLALWGDALYGDRVLTEASGAEMIKLNRDDYGLGLQRVELPGVVGYGHTGLLNTYTSLLIHLPVQRVTLALLVNRSDVELGTMLAAAPPNGRSLLELVGVEMAVEAAGH